MVLAALAATGAPFAAPGPRSPLDLSALQDRLNEAVDLVADEQFADAEDWFETLVESCGAQAELFHNLAVVRAAQGRYGEALDALRESPSLPEASQRLLASLNSLQGLTAEQPELVESTVRLRLVEVDLEGACGLGSPVEVEREAIVTQSNEVARSEGEGAVAVEPDRLAADRSVRRAIEGWAAAWSDRDVEDYLSRYSKRFSPPGGDRAAWETHRRQMILEKKTIRVATLIDAVDLAAGGDKATVRFFQTYDSDRFSDRGFTTLELVREGGDWKIVTQTFEPKP